MYSCGKGVSSLGKYDEKEQKMKTSCCYRCCYQKIDCEPLITSATFSPLRYLWNVFLIQLSRFFLEETVCYVQSCCGVRPIPTPQSPHFPEGPTCRV